MFNSKGPLISVIMNCHNGSKFINRSVNSIRKQRYKNWELIFWDNQSTDNSFKILKKYQNLKGINTLDAVIMFCPNEAAISSLGIASRKMMDYAIEKKNHISWTSYALFYT